MKTDVGEAMQKQEPKPCHMPNCEELAQVSVKTVKGVEVRYVYASCKHHNKQVGE